MRRSPGTKEITGYERGSKPLASAGPGRHAEGRDHPARRRSPRCLGGRSRSGAVGRRAALRLPGGHGQNATGRLQSRGRGPGGVRRRAQVLRQSGFRRGESAQRGDSPAGAGGPHGARAGHSRQRPAGSAAAWIGRPRLVGGADPGRCRRAAPRGAVEPARTQPGHGSARPARRGADAFADRGARDRRNVRASVYWLAEARAVPLAGRPRSLVARPS